MTGDGDRPIVLTGGRIHPTASASTVPAIAIRNGRIIALGDSETCRSAVGDGAPSVELDGRCVIPGLVDAHLHWAGHAMLRRQLHLGPDLEIEAVRRRVAERAGSVPTGEWIVGRGWDHAEWGRWPGREDLDDVAPAHPVALVRKDGHAMWVNSLALAVAGVGPSTPQPPGGVIEMVDGAPTGILKESALALVRQAMPEPTGAEVRDAMVGAWPDAWRHGITAAHDMGFGPRSLYRPLAQLHREGRLGLRFVVYSPYEALDELVSSGLRSGDGDAWLRVGGQKLFLDGTLGSRTAFMLAPYDDAAHDGDRAGLGVAILEPETLADQIERAAAAGLATAVHAIGDAANRMALDAFEAVAAHAPPGVRPLRHRIEHAQLLHPRDFPRFASLGVVASMQPIHCTSDAEVAKIAWGARTRGAYAWRSLIDAGARVAFGSDAPIETFDVMAGIHAALTRSRPTERPAPAEAFVPEQAVRLDEALYAYTVDAAWAGGQEADIGQLSPGRCADLVILDADPFEVPPEAAHHVRAVATMIDGRWVWRDESLDLPVWQGAD